MFELIPGWFGSALAGKAVERAFKRPSKRISVNENWESFGLSIRPRVFFVPVTHPDELTPLHDQGDVTRYGKPYRWLRENKGLDVGNTSFQFTVHARNGTVDVVGVEPFIRELTEARPGLALVPPPSGGPLDTRHLSVNLDTGTWEHRNLGTDATPGDLVNPTEPATQLVASIPSGDTEQFHVEGFTTTHSVEWWLVLKLRVNGKAVKAAVKQENGQPFVTLRRDDPSITARYEFRDGQWIGRD